MQEKETKSTNVVVLDRLLQMEGSLSHEGHVDVSPVALQYLLASGVSLEWWSNCWSSCWEPLSSQYWEAGVVI